MSMAKIIAQDLEMRFDDKHLFSAQELIFPQKQVIHLQGDNGSGKTTLMKLLAGLIKPSHGQVQAVGYSLAPWWRSNAIVGKALYLHQHPYLFDGSVLYNLTYPLAFSSEDKAKLSARTEQAIEMAQLSHLLGQSASSLSGGERQRLAIARAWIVEPKLLMLDEPTSNMDKHSQRLVLQMVSDLKQQGTGMIISSHQSCMLTQICDHAWLIDNNKISTNDMVHAAAPTLAVHINPNMLNSMVK
ncbi:energy-coupling factor ABC transporter ATP-binding protein [Shewanella gelidimarina]|uniref:ABC transporter ATP-binding protein n=1 Tax=Shewanella gelidimarina TaxID=56813 RepID=UPI00200C3966|nr:energy-coupling factor ABC transporter ATP-binding protein [Shewanella gelidimarina]